MIRHTEKHFTAGETVRDIVIGMSDGLTVPFALAAGLTGAISDSHLIVTAGFAEIAAGAIAMGLGGFLAAKGDADHFASEKAREEFEIANATEVEAQEVRDIFRSYGISPEECEGVLQSLRQRPKDWTAFMMRFELGLEEPVAGRAWKSALTISIAYALGGTIPLASYLVIDNAHTAMGVSAVFTLVALAIFGAIKGKFTGVGLVKSAIQTTLIGGLAAGAAFGIAKLIG